MGRGRNTARIGEKRERKHSFRSKKGKNMRVVFQREVSGSARGKKKIIPAIVKAMGFLGGKTKWCYM